MESIFISSMNLTELKQIKKPNLYISSSLRSALCSLKQTKHMDEEYMVRDSLNAFPFY